MFETSIAVPIASAPKSGEPGEPRARDEPLERLEPGVPVVDVLRAGHRPRAARRARAPPRGARPARATSTDVGERVRPRRPRAARASSPSDSASRASAIVRTAPPRRGRPGASRCAAPRAARSRSRAGREVDRDAARRRPSRRGAARAPPSAAAKRPVTNTATKDRGGRDERDVAAARASPRARGAQEVGEAASWLRRPRAAPSRRRTTTRPPRGRRRACLYRSSSERSWVATTTVVPRAFAAWSRSITSSVRSGSRLPVGSSARRSAGSPTSARATATRCCSPPESDGGNLPLLPRARATQDARARAGAPRAARSPRTSSGNATFSATVRSGRSLKSWNTTPMLRRTYGIARRADLRDVPAEDQELAGRRRLGAEEQLERACDFPAPDGPVRKTNSPFFDVERDVAASAGPSPGVLAS